MEQKSIPDLIPSFNSGRLRVFGGTFTSTELADYPQYELMLQPILLIEFEENRAFLTEIGFQYPLNANALRVHVHFPRVCMHIPYATADVFNNPEPDPTRTRVIGAEGGPEIGAAINATGEEPLRDHSQEHQASDERLRDLCR